jgi:hypothetical protein
MVFARGAFSRGLLIDADEDSLASVKPNESADELLKAKSIDAEVALIVQGGTVWALYDTNNDKKHDLALMTTNGTDESWLFATSAWKLGGPGEMTPAPEHVGRRLLRPGLVSLPRVATAFKGSNFGLASDEGIGSLPDPLAPKGDFHFREMKGFPKGTVIEAQSSTASAMLVDLDSDTKLAAKADPEKVVNDGKYDAEVAIVSRGGLQWIYYDTDGDKKFDLVLFVPKSGQDPTQAFRVVKKASGAATLEVDGKSVAGRPFRHKSVFKDKAMAAKWKTLAGRMFRPTSVEE